MYIIIGGDGREYGPVTTDQVRAWLAAGRANLDTKARQVGTEEWKPLGEFPAFGSGGFTPSARAQPADETFVPGAPAEPAAASSLEIAVCYERGWQLFKAQWAPLIGVTLLVMLLGFIASSALQTMTGTKALTPDSLTSPGFLGKYFAILLGQTLLISIPLDAGCLYYFLKKARGEPTSIADVFAAFGRVYPSLLVAGFLAGLLVTLGCCFFLLPGIYFAVAYRLVPLLIVDRKLGPWEAMELSRRAVTSHWWAMLGLLVVAILLLVAGIMALIVGVFIAIPFTNCALIYAYLSLLPPHPAAAEPAAG